MLCAGGGAGVYIYHAGNIQIAANYKGKVGVCNAGGMKEMEERKTPRNGLLDVMRRIVKNATTNAIKPYQKNLTYRFLIYSSQYRCRSFKGNSEARAVGY